MSNAPHSSVRPKTIAPSWDFRVMPVQAFVEFTSSEQMAIAVMNVLVICILILGLSVSVEIFVAGLTRIRPNNCAFKDIFFGSNALESDFGGIKIGVAPKILPGAGRLNNRKRGAGQSDGLGSHLHSRFPKARAAAT